MDTFGKEYSRQESLPEKHSQQESLPNVFVDRVLSEPELKILREASRFLKLESPPHNPLANMISHLQKKLPSDLIPLLNKQLPQEIETRQAKPTNKLNAQPVDHSEVQSTSPEKREPTRDQQLIIDLIEVIRSIPEDFINNKRFIAHLMRHVYSDDPWFWDFAKQLYQKFNTEPKNTEQKSNAFNFLFAHEGINDVVNAWSLAPFLLHRGCSIDQLLEWFSRLEKQLANNQSIDNTILKSESVPAPLIVFHCFSYDSLFFFGSQKKRAVADQPSQLSLSSSPLYQIADKIASQLAPIIIKKYQTV